HRDFFAAAQICAGVRIITKSDTVLFINQPGFQTREGQERCYRRHPNLSWEENNRAARRRTGEGCHPPSIYERRLRSPRDCVDRKENAGCRPCESSSGIAVDVQQRLNCALPSVSLKLWFLSIPKSSQHIRR